MNNELLRGINSIQGEIESLNRQIEDLKSQVSAKEEALGGMKDALLSQMVGESMDEYHDEGGKLFATVITKTNIGYSSDADVIAKLKGAGYAQFIKTKTTEALDKNPLKKEIKANKELEGLLSTLIVKTTSSYVVVTTEENHAKMLEHIESGKKGN